MRRTLAGFVDFAHERLGAPSPPVRRRRWGVLALSSETGRGHRRARSFDHRPQGGTAWGRCGLLFLGFDAPHGARQGAAREGCRSAVGAGRPATRRTVAARTSPSPCQRRRAPCRRHRSQLCGAVCGLVGRGRHPQHEAPRPEPGRYLRCEVTRPASACWSSATAATSSCASAFAIRRRVLPGLLRAFGAEEQSSRSASLAMSPFFNFASRDMRGREPANGFQNRGLRHMPEVTLIGGLPPRGHIPPRPAPVPRRAGAAWREASPRPPEAKHTANSRTSSSCDFASSAANSSAPPPARFRLPPVAVRSATAAGDSGQSGAMPSSRSCTVRRTPSGRSCP